MNNNYIFRCWSTRAKEWMFGYETLGGFSLVGELVLCGGYGDYPLARYFEDFIITQYSGIDDRDGQKIYAGDIFQVGAELDVFEVRFEHGCFMAYKEGKQFGLIGELKNCYIKVIGNIFENPKLIQDENSNV